MNAVRQVTSTLRVMLLLSVAIIASLGNALAADSNLAWDESNIKTLRTLNQADLAALVNLLPPGSGVVIHPEPASIGEFAWTDLQGNGTYQLLMTLDVNGRHFYNSLVIYSRDSSGRLASQEIRGWAIRNLAKVTKDINGDGKDELIVPSQLPSDTYRGAAGMAIWPVVYREKNGQYLEASGEFRSFYESQVLPELDRKIAEVRQKLDKGLATAHDLAIAIMARDKVLRIIGRDPRAGEREARKWMASQDPELRSDAAAVLGDIGGHEDDLRALRADGNSSVANSAQFAMSHGASSIQRFNSAAASGSSQ